MDGIKNVLASKTVWGAALAVAGALAGIFHVNFGPADQAAAADAISALISAAGGLIAIWGRITATKKIG